MCRATRSFVVVLVGVACSFGTSAAAVESAKKPENSASQQVQAHSIGVNAGRIMLPLLELRYERQIDKQSAWSVLAGYGGGAGKVAVESFTRYSLGGRYMRTFAGTWRTGLFWGAVARSEINVLDAVRPVAGDPGQFGFSQDNVAVDATGRNIALALAPVIGARAGNQKAFAELTVGAGLHWQHISSAVADSEHSQTATDLWVPVAFWLGLFL